MTVFLPRHLSVSSVELYAKCSAQWKQRYIDKIDRQTAAMAWGSAFHAALEAGHKGKDAEGAWMRAWNDARAVVVGRGEVFMPNKSHGLELLEKFEQRALSVECPAEVRFSLPFPGGRIVNPTTKKPVPLLGFIDATPPSETREYKTSKGGWWTEVKAQLAHQTHVYGWARQRVQGHRRPMRYVIFGTRNPTITEYIVEPSPDGFRVFEQLAETVWRGIVDGNYDGCGACEVCDPKVDGVANGSLFALDDIA